MSHCAQPVYFHAELLASSDPPPSASQRAGIAGVSCRPGLFIFMLKLPQVGHPVLLPIPQCYFNKPLHLSNSSLSGLSNTFCGLALVPLVRGWYQGQDPECGGRCVQAFRAELGSVCAQPLTIVPFTHGFGYPWSATLQKY